MIAARSRRYGRKTRAVSARVVRYTAIPTSSCSGRADAARGEVDAKAASAASA